MAGSGLARRCIRSSARARSSRFCSANRRIAGPDRGGGRPGALQAPPRARRAQAARGAPQPGTRRADGEGGGAQLTPLRRQASAAEQLRTVESELAETRGRLLAGELEGPTRERGGAPRELDGVDERRRRPSTPGSPRWRPRGARGGCLRAPLEERERHAKRVLRARVLTGGSRVARAHRAAPRPGRRARARGGGRARAPGQRARGSAGGAETPTWPAEERAWPRLEAAEAEHARARRPSSRRAPRR